MILVYLILELVKGFRYKFFLKILGNQQVSTLMTFISTYCRYYKYCFETFQVTILHIVLSRPWYCYVLMVYCFPDLGQLTWGLEGCAFTSFEH